VQYFSKPKIIFIAYQSCLEDGFHANTIVGAGFERFAYRGLLSSGGLFEISKN
jgi:hypothetical protein